MPDIIFYFIFFKKINQTAILQKLKRFRYNKSCFIIWISFKSLLGLRSLSLKNSSCQLSIFNFSWFVSHKHIKDGLIRVGSCFNGRNLYYSISLGQYITNLTKYLAFYIIKIEKIKTISGNPKNNIERRHHAYFS